MKKLHSIAFYALVAPAMTLGAGSLLAQPAAGQEYDREQQGATRAEGAARAEGGAQTSPAITRGEATTRAGQADPNSTADSRSAHDAAGQTANQSANRSVDLAGNAGDKSHMENRGYLSAAPTNGMQASDLIGMEISTSSDDDVGSIDDLIIDENGQIVAVVVGFGGLLGVGEKSIAIGWDDVERSGTADEQELRVNVTRDSLMSAPEYDLDD